MLIIHGLHMLPPVEEFVFLSGFVHPRLPGRWAGGSLLHPARMGRSATRVLDVVAVPLLWKQHQPLLTSSLVLLRVSVP